MHPTIVQISTPRVDFTRLPGAELSIGLTVTGLASTMRDIWVFLG